MGSEWDIYMCMVFIHFIFKNNVSISNIPILNLLLRMRWKIKTKLTEPCCILHLYYDKGRKKNEDRNGQVKEEQKERQTGNLACFKSHK